jgi:hypothetical protein
MKLSNSFIKGKAFFTPNLVKKGGYFLVLSLLFVGMTFLSVEAEKDIEQEDLVLQNIFFVPFLIYSNAEYGTELPDELVMDFTAYQDGELVLEYDHPLQLEELEWDELEQYDKLSMMFEDEDYTLRIEFVKNDV